MLSGGSPQRLMRGLAVGAGGEQEVDDGAVVVVGAPAVGRAVGRPAERRAAVLAVAGVDRGAQGEQQPDHRRVAVPGGVVQRSAAPGALPRRGRSPARASAARCPRAPPRRPGRGAAGPPRRAVASSPGCAREQRPRARAVGRHAGAEELVDRAQRRDVGAPLAEESRHRSVAGAHRQGVGGGAVLPRPVERGAVVEERSPPARGSRP